MIRSAFNLTGSLNIIKDATIFSDTRCGSFNPLRYLTYTSVMFNKWMRRDNKRRILYNQYEGERLRWKMIAKSTILPKDITKQAKKTLHEDYPRDSSITRIRNRCNLTGRPRGIVRQYGISRIKFRELADAGKFAGVTRSSW